MPRNEAALVRQIVRRIREENPDAWVFKTVGSPYQMPGVPDLILSIDGLFLGLEVKHIKPGESAEHAMYRATNQQRAHIRRINDSGGVARVVTSPEEALAAIARAREQARERWRGTDAQHH